MGTLEGKTAVVTGGSRGIGRAIVHRLAAEGASVAFSFLSNQAAADEVVAEVSAASPDSPGPKVIALRADQGSIADQQRLMAQADEALGGLDILVNNAGIGTAQLFTEITEADYDLVMGVHVKGPPLLRPAQRHRPGLPSDTRPSSARSHSQREPRKPQFHHSSRVATVMIVYWTR